MIVVAAHHGPVGSAEFPWEDLPTSSASLRRSRELKGWDTVQRMRYAESNDGTKGSWPRRRPLVSVPLPLYVYRGPYRRGSLVHAPEPRLFEREGVIVHSLDAESVSYSYEGRRYTCPLDPDRALEPQEEPEPSKWARRVPRPVAHTVALRRIQEARRKEAELASLKEARGAKLFEEARLARVAEMARLKAVAENQRLYDRPHRLASERSERSDIGPHLCWQICGECGEWAVFTTAGLLAWCTHCYRRTEGLL